MRKFAFIGIIGLFIAVYFIIETRMNKPTPEQEKRKQEDIAEKAYFKEVFKSFKVNGLSIMVGAFKIDKRSDSTILSVNYLVTSLDSSVTVPSSFFKVRDETREYFYPQSKTIEVSTITQEITLRYSLPPVSHYFLYHVVLEGNNPSEKAIVVLHKNYRAEG